MNIQSAGRVLILRSPQQASVLAECLRALGAVPILLPAIELAEPASFLAMDQAIAHLDTFDWLVFTSANAAERFAARLQRSRSLQQADGALSPPAKLRAELSLPQYAAIGPATAEAIVTSGLAASRNDVLLPPQFVAESLTAELLPFAVQSDGRPTRFLLVRAEEARELLPEALRTAGGSVVIAPAYRTVMPESSVRALQQLFTSPEQVPDAITFTSSSSVRNLLTLCEAAGVTIPANSLLISIGPITSRTLRELGVAPDREAAEATVQALAEATLQALETKRR